MVVLIVVVLAVVGLLYWFVTILGVFVVELSGLTS